jgi:hypothetical protein
MKVEVDALHEPLSRYTAQFGLRPSSDHPIKHEYDCR